MSTHSSDNDDERLNDIYLYRPHTLPLTHLVDLQHTHTVDLPHTHPIELPLTHLVDLHHTPC